MEEIKKNIGPSMSQSGFTSYVIKYGAFLTLLILVLFNSLFTKNFFNINTLWNVVIQSSTIMLLSLGMTIVIATGGIDISVGSIMAFSSILAAKFISQGAIWEGVGIGLVAAILIGAFNGAIISHFKIQPMIATLAMMYMLRGLAQVVNNGRILSFKQPQFTQIAYIRIGNVIPVQLIIVVIVIILIYVLLKKTRFGVYVQSYGDNKIATKMSGVNTGILLIVVYGLCALLAGASGIIETARIEASDPSKIGKMVELDAIAATAIGGTPLIGGKANILGTVMGVYIMQIITVMVNMNNIQYAYSLVIKTVIVVLALYLQKRNAK